VATNITNENEVKPAAPAEVVPASTEPQQQQHSSPTRRRERGPRMDRSERPKSDLMEKVVFVNRCAKVVKGGRRFSFSALIVVGDQKGQVGYGFGKANEVADAIKKGTEMARRSMIKICLQAATIPHEVEGRFGGGRVMLKPASPGTGLIAGGGVRAVVEAAGIRDVLSKSLGSGNMANVVKATLQGLRQLRRREEIMQRRGLKIHEGGTAAAA